MQNTDTTRDSGIKGRKKKDGYSSEKNADAHKNDSRFFSFSLSLVLTLEQCARSEERNTGKETGGQFAHL